MIRFSKYCNNNGDRSQTLAKYALNKDCKAVLSFLNLVEFLLRIWYARATQVWRTQELKIPSGIHLQSLGYQQDLPKLTGKSYNLSLIYYEVYVPHQSITSHTVKQRPPTRCHWQEIRQPMQFSLHYYRPIYSALWTVLIGSLLRNSSLHHKHKLILS